MRNKLNAHEHCIVLDSNSLVVRLRFTRDSRHG